MSARHTDGPIEVRMEGTLTGIWAEIGQVCIDPNTGKEWWRELGRTDTTHVRRQDCYQQMGEFGETPEQYALEPDGAEHIANALLWAAAPDLLSELEALVTAVTFADPPKLFNGVECHEARVPVEFIEGARAAIAKALNAAPAHYGQAPTAQVIGDIRCGKDDHE